MQRLEPEEEQAALCESVRAFCANRASRISSPRGNPAIDLSEIRNAWLQLAELGIFEIGLVGAEGTRLDVVYVLEELGKAGFAGPLADTFAALIVATGTELDDLAAGRRWASFEAGERFMWADEDALLYRVEAELPCRLQPKEVVSRRSTVGGLPSSTIETTVVETYPHSEGVSDALNICTAAYLVGLSRSMLQISSDHARARRQFGRTLGEFQAVSYALADADALVLSAQYLVRQAAVGDGSRRLGSAARRAASDAAVHTASVCHQVCGGLGFTLEFALWSRSRIAVQVATQGRISAIDAELLDGMRGSVTINGNER